jgi:hypothetical protein
LQLNIQENPVVSATVKTFRNFAPNTVNVIQKETTLTGCKGGMKHCKKY